MPISRAFIRSYAVEVGLDPKETVRAFLERFNEEPPPSADTIGSAVPRQHRALQGERRKPVRMLAITGAIIIAIVIAGVLLWRARGKHASATTPREVASYAISIRLWIPASSRH